MGPISRWAVSSLVSSAFGLLSRRLAGRYSRVEERRGRVPRLGGPVVWLHGVSVGEVQAASPVVSALRHMGFAGSLALSSITETGLRVASSVPGVDLVVAYPWDRVVFVRRFLDGLDPRVYVVMETELWPVMIWEARRRGVRLVLANGRVSDRSYRRMRAFGWLYRDLLGCFDSVFPRTGLDRERFLELGVPEGVLGPVGDVKVDAVLSRRGTEDLSGYAFRGDLFVAGSTHPGEDREVLVAYRMARGVVGGLKLALVPRHPERASECLELCSREGLRAVRFSEDPGLAGLAGGVDVVVVDRVGVLFGLYGLARVAFVGGSLVPKGGQNPLEPACWSVPVLFGPHMEDFAEVRDRMVRGGCGFPVASGEDMGAKLIQILTSGCKIDPCGLLDGLSGASRRVADRVLSLLDEGCR